MQIETDDTFRNRNILLNSFWSNKGEKIEKKQESQGIRKKIYTKDFVIHNIYIHKFKGEKNL